MVCLTKVTTGTSRTKKLKNSEDVVSMLPATETLSLETHVTYTTLRKMVGSSLVRAITVHDEAKLIYGGD